MKTKKNIHLIAYKAQLDPQVQIAVLIDEKERATVEIGQGCQIVNTMTLSGNKTLNALSPTKEKQIDLQLCEELTEKREKTLEEMAANTQYLVDTFGTALEKKHVKNLLTKVK